MSTFLLTLTLSLVLPSGSTEASARLVDAYPVCPTRRHASKCSLYLENSTIPGAGVGIFTVDHLSPGELVGYGDVANPFIDLFWHHRANYEQADHPFKDYVWQAVGILGLESADLYHQTYMMGNGLEAAINCHLALVNTHSANFRYDDFSDLLHRNEDPGAGAFTPYSSGRTLVAYDIPPGGELFKMYGDDWFLDRSEEFGAVPLSNDYLRADILIQKFGVLFLELQIQSTSALSQIQKDLWGFMTAFPFPSRTLDALPKNPHHIPLAVEQGIWSSYMLDATKPVNNLEESGRCLDNISHGPSTLPQAGRGAFAVQSFQEGAILTGSPLVHVDNITFFEMYQAVYDKLSSYERSDKFSDIPPTKNEVHTYQIALNYCWQHPESTILLCPYGAGVNYINHNWSGANVKVQWAPNGVIGHDSSYLQRSLQELVGARKPCLAFDYVAIRDIKEGEELFVDYGAKWETAWQDHVKNYKKNKFSALYRSAQQWNTEHGKSPLRTEFEQEKHPYPSNLELRCHPLVGASLISITFPRQHDYTWTIKDAGTRCRVLDRSKTEQGYYLYRVGVDDHNFAYAPPEHGKYRDRCFEVEVVPRGAIAFFNAPYTTDLHIRGTFRHPIGIPDKIFPSAWKT